MIRRLAEHTAHNIGRAIGKGLDHALGQDDGPPYRSTTAPAAPAPPYCGEVIRADAPCVAPILLGVDGTPGVFACGECSACRA